MRGKRRRDVRPSPESIEPRTLLSGFSPTDVEQFYLELLDDARFNPAAYGSALGIDLSGAAPAQPLAMNPMLVQSARLHSQDMIAQGYFAHVTPQGVDPGGRIAAEGFAASGWAESIESNTEPSQFGGSFPADFATWDAGLSLSDLIVDQGVPDLGHRVMLLDIGGLDQAMRQVGIGIASQDTTGAAFSSRQTDTTIDLAAPSSSQPFLTGVVFHDSAGNGKYQPGEGLSGVTITVAGVGSTTTMDAGGYAIPLAPGTYTVTASGGGLPQPIQRTVILGNDNVRLDFDEDPNGTLLHAAPSGMTTGSLSTFRAIAAGDTSASYSARIDWGDGNASFATLTANPDGTFNVQGSNDYARPGNYAVRVLITHLRDGQTVALNATVAVNGSTYSGPAFPSPAYPGQGTGGSGIATSGGGSHHRRHHPKPVHKPRHPLHAVLHQHTAKRPIHTAKAPKIAGRARLPHRVHGPVGV
jgi:hypothetical protein